jgi:hypothetical protein
MNQTTCCPKCGKRMVPVVTISGRTDLQCISYDDPALKSAESPLTAPEKPIVLERDERHHLINQAFSSTMRTFQRDTRQ